MSDAADPDWSALPHDPERFFELDQEPYDRRELKRRYARLIKRFKPERQPEEFQRIRQAYEELEARLRYAGTEESGPRPPRESGTSQEERLPGDSGAEAAGAEPEVTLPSWERPDPASEDSIQWQSLSRPPESTWAEREPADLYDELVGKRSRSPSEVYALAVLSDLVQDDPNGLAFLSHLADGLAEQPYHPGLRSVLDRFLATLPVEECPAVLLRLAERWGAGLYFPTTEATWLRYFRAVDFAEFQSTLSRCEDALDERLSPSSLVFLLRIARAACFKADEEWLESRTEWIFDHGARLGPAFGDDLDFFEVLLQYRRLRSAFLGPNPNPTRRRIDQVIRDWCEQPELEAQASFLAAQVELAESGLELLAELPYGEEEQLAALIPFFHIAEEMQSLAGVDRELPEQTEAQRKVHEFANRLERVTDRSRYGTLWNLWGLGYMGVLGLLVFIPAIAAGWVVSLFSDSSAAVGITFWISLMVWGIVFWKWVRPRWIEPTRIRGAERIARRCYRKVWRPEVFQFLRSSHLPVEIVRHELDELDDEKITNDDWVSLLMHEDYGLEFFALSQRFLH